MKAILEYTENVVDLPEDFENHAEDHKAKEFKRFIITLGDCAKTEGERMEKAIWEYLENPSEENRIDIRFLLIEMRSTLDFIDKHTNGEQNESSKISN